MQHDRPARPQDASFRIVGGEPQVVPARDGRDVRTRRRDRAVPRRAHQDRRRPARSTSRASRRQPRLHHRRGRTRSGSPSRSPSFTTHFPYAAYRNQNLGRAAELVDGTLLKPGETFSLNDTVGERTAANGFTKGFIISDGVFKEDFGGGVSQVATTTFNAAFFAGLEDVEHKPHSFYIDRYPVGREATVAWGARRPEVQEHHAVRRLHPGLRRPGDPVAPGRDARVDVLHEVLGHQGRAVRPLRRHLAAGPGSSAARSACPNTGYGGFDIDVYRLFYKAGSATLDHRETMHTRYTPSDTVVCS